jgi:hypothetical protein
VVVFAMLSIGALFAGAQWLPGQSSTPQNSAPVAAPRNTETLDPLPHTGGIGGPDLESMPRNGKDPRTGVELNYGLATKAWGTQVSFTLSGVKGPLICSLVAVRTNGAPVVLSTWTVGENGWGTAKQPKALMLQAPTALPKDQIAHLQVTAVRPDGGKTETLVSV